MITLAVRLVPNTPTPGSMARFVFRAPDVASAAAAATAAAERERSGGWDRQFNPSAAGQNQTGWSIEGMVQSRVHQTTRKTTRFMGTVAQRGHTVLARSLSLTEPSS
ncbi:hypothetical protein PAMP_011456 [Pampus punctatissimus]